jgi:hypothetical protein
MKPRKMQSRVMWAVVGKDGTVFEIFSTRARARSLDVLYEATRVVRVRVTEAP